MSDYRTTVYNRYVTTARGEERYEQNERAIDSFMAWCKYKYLPLLEGLRPDDPVLELGCGPGYILRFLKKEGFVNVEGIDISEEQLEIAIGQGLNPKLRDVFEYLPTVENSYNAMIAVDFVEHFTKDELMRLVPLIFKSLKKGGIFIVQTPNGEGLFPNEVLFGDLTHSTILTPRSLQQLLAISGFTEFRFEEANPTPKNFVGIIRVILWKGIKFIANTVRKIESGKSQKIWSENMLCRCQKPEI
jgi:SAM-dependent methyltransferase